MTPAVRNALAFCHVTGRFPSHIHLPTWSTAREHVGPMDSHASYQVKAESLDAVRLHPLCRAAAFLKGLGFTLDAHSNRRGRHAVRSLAFYCDDPQLEGYASTHGGGWFWVRRDSRPFQLSLPYTAESVEAYQDTDDAWTAWQGMARTLLGESYDPPATITPAGRRCPLAAYHAGMTPLAYAVAVVRAAHDKA